MTEPSNIDAPKGGAEQAPPDVVSGVLSDDGKLRSRTGDLLGTYTVSASWKLPNGTHLGHLQAVIDGVPFKAQGGVAIGSTVRFYSPAAWKARNAAARQKAQKPAPSPAQQLAATHAQPPPPAPPTPTLEVTVRGLRRHVVLLLKAVDPVGYRQYARVKYEGTDSPSLAQRRRAYLFAFQRLLEHGYNVPNTD